MGRVIAIANEKGGAGKSTMAANLGAAWGARGRRVLLIDLDPQFNLTEMVGAHPNQAEQTIAEVLAEDVPIADAAIDVLPGVQLVPGSKRMADVEHTLVTQRSRERYLRRQLFDSGQIADGGWDYVLIDCPPNLGDLTVNALYVEPEVVTPIDMTDRNAYKGAASLLETIAECREDCPSLAISLAVPNAVQGERLVYRGLVEQLSALGVPVARSNIPLAADFQNSGAEGRPLVVARPGSRGARAYLDLTAELEGLGQQQRRAA